MSNNPTLIIGAGLAGLIAGHAWPQARIVEAAPEPRQAHQALLRFRSEAVSQLTGIEFQRVLVRKSIWSGGRHHSECNPALANLYARKVLGRVSPDRSIWNLEPVERFIAPPDFYGRMLEQIGKRITWGEALPFNSRWTSPVITTAPLDVTSTALDGPKPEFKRAPIRVLRVGLPNVEAHQTIYFPDPNTTLYRASITGSTLIMEFAGPLNEREPRDAGHVRQAFGLCSVRADGSLVEQKYGKIADIDANVRKQLIFRLSHELNLYSLGRFATWRNILLDDVVQDIAVIKRLIRSGSTYDARLGG